MRSLAWGRRGGRGGRVGWVRGMSVAAGVGGCGATKGEGGQGGAPLHTEGAAGGGEEGEVVGFGRDVGPLVGHEVGEDLAEVFGGFTMADEEARVEAGGSGVE